MAVTRCSVIFVLVQVDGFGVLEVVREVSHQEQVLSQPGAAYFFSGFPPVLGDRQESLEPGAEVYLGLLTGRFVEKLAKDFSPTLNDIRLPCGNSNELFGRHVVTEEAACALGKSRVRWPRC